jgi:NADH:ubiquinone oxidoreductase subunit K
MGIGLMLLAIILFFIGFLTPISNVLTFPLSLLVFVIGIARILQKKER